jgi:hypothetical protein
MIADNVFWPWILLSPDQNPFINYFKLCNRTEYKWLTYRKVNLSLSLYQHHVMKAYGVESQLHAFLTSVLYGGECSASSFHHFIPMEIAPDTNWTRDWVGPRTGFSLFYICICCVKNWPSFFGTHHCIFFSVFRSISQISNIQKRGINSKLSLAWKNWINLNLLN